MVVGYSSDVEDMKPKRQERPIRIPLRPVHGDDGERKDLKKIVQEIRELRKSAKLGKINVRELIDEGRRY